MSFKTYEVGIRNFILIGIVLINACQDKDPSPIVAGLPTQIRSLKLSLSPYTNSETLIANGQNFIEFWVEAFDNNNNHVYLDPSLVRVQNGKNEELTYPFRFTTTVAGKYNFKIKDYPESEILVTAIEPILFESTSLPVIFHYINTGSDSLSEKNKETIQKILVKNLDSVNVAFANEAHSKDPNATDTGVRFYLADKNPENEGLKWKGVHFVDHVKQPFLEIDISSELWDFLWNGNFWPPKKYINVWVIDATFSKRSKLNFAFLPSLSSSINQYPDYPYGVYFQQSNIDIGTFDILAHELGHLFNLNHVFDLTCVDPDNCSDTQNYIRDSNEVWRNYSLQKLSCSNSFFASTNYMDYSLCDYNTFTLQQTLIIQTTLELCPFLPTKKNISESGRSSTVKKIDFEYSSKYRIIN